MTAQVSRLRREAPGAGARGYAERLDAQIAREEDEHTSQVRELREEREGSGKEQEENMLDLDKTREGYYEDVRGTYERGLEELGRLAGVSRVEGSSGSGGSGGVNGGVSRRRWGKCNERGPWLWNSNEPQIEVPRWVGTVYEFGICNDTSSLLDQSLPCVFCVLACHHVVSSSQAFHSF